MQKSWYKIYVIIHNRQSTIFFLCLFIYEYDCLFFYVFICEYIFDAVYLFMIIVCLILIFI